MDLEGEEEKSQGGVHLQYKQIRESVVKNTSRWTVNDKHIIMTPLTKVSLNCHSVGLDNNFKDEGRTNNRVRAKLKEKRKKYFIEYIHTLIKRFTIHTNEAEKYDQEPLLPKPVIYPMELEDTAAWSFYTSSQSTRKIPACRKCMRFRDGLLSTHRITWIPQSSFSWRKSTLLEMNDPMGQRSGPSRQMQM